jgi:hypothetical protein
VRAEIAREIRFITTDLAEDLATIPPLAHLNRDAREVVAHLIVGTVTTMTGELLDVPPDAGADDAEAELARRTVRQLTIIVRGAAVPATPEG